MLLKKISIEQKIVLDQSVVKAKDRYIVIIPEEPKPLQFAVVQIGVEQDDTFTYSIIGSVKTKKALFEIKEVENVNGCEYNVCAEAWIPMGDNPNSYSIVLLATNSGKLYMPKRIIKASTSEEKEGFFGTKNVTKDDADAEVFTSVIEGENVVPDNKVDMKDLDDDDEPEEDEDDKKE